MQEHPEKHHGCFPLFTNYAEAVERLAFSSEAITRLAGYRDTVNKLERCPGAEKHLAARAHAAENDTRVLLKCALDSLNELRDSREIEKMVKGGSKVRGPGGDLDLRKAIAGARTFLEEMQPEVDLKFLDESAQLFEEFSLNVRLNDDRVTSSIKVPDGGSHKASFSPKVLPGQVGRVGTSEFFGRVGALLTLTDPAFADDDCHHRKQAAGLDRQASIDYYAHLVGGFAHARDAMARHTQVASHFGRPHIKAHPVAVIIVIAAVAAALIVAGVTLLIGCANGAWNGSACELGRRRERRRRQKKGTVRLRPVRRSSAARVLQARR